MAKDPTLAAPGLFDLGFGLSLIEAVGTSNRRLVGRCSTVAAAVALTTLATSVLVDVGTVRALVE